jgi:uncharacterized protein
VTTQPRFDFPGGGRFRRLGPVLRERFGARVQKVTLRGGFGCPNRDGRVGTGGCVFCSAEALVPRCKEPFAPIEMQLQAGLAVLQRRHQGPVSALAYFQEGTATDAPVERLSQMYRAVLANPHVVALAIGTRPDWISHQVYQLLSDLARERPVFLELGLQVANETLLQAMNRGHTVADFVRAVDLAHQHHLEVVTHVILNFPHTAEADRVDTARLLNQLQVEGVKIHNLYIIKGTPLAHAYAQGQLELESLHEYCAMTVRFLQDLDPRMVIHRLTGEGPPELMLAPAWAADKAQVLRAIGQELEKQDAWQGQYFRQ